MSARPIAITAGLGLIVLFALFDGEQAESVYGAVGVEVVAKSRLVSPQEGAAGSEPRGIREGLNRRAAVRVANEFNEWWASGGKDLAAGVRLARERRVALKWMIRNDPEAALEYAVGYGERKRMPSDVVALLEEPISDAAEFEWLMACPLEDGSGADVGESRWVTLEEDGRRLEAFVFGRRSELGTKDRVSVHGVALDGMVAVAEHPVRRMSQEEEADIFGAEVDGVGIEVFGEPVVMASDVDVMGRQAELEEGEDAMGPELAESPWTEGAKRILYIRVRFSDDEPDAEPLSFDSAESRQNDVAEFYRLTSYGKVSVETEITDVVTLPDTHGSYSGQGLGRMMDDARAGAILLGDAEGKDWDYDNYDFYTVVSRGGIGGYAGVAQVGGRKAHLQSTSLRTAGHEYGHNFGLGHSYYNYTTSLRPTGQASVNGLRPLVSYGHRFSIQSAQSGGDFNNPALPQFTVHEKNRLDWLTDAEYADISSSADGGLYRVFRNDHVDAGGIQALRLPARSEGTSNRRYWLSYRAAWAPPTRSSENFYLTHGALINWTRDSGSYSTQLDLTPYSDDGSHRSGSTWTRDNDDKWDSALLVGRTFSDHEKGVHVTPVARGGAAPGEYLDVFVHVEGEREEIWVSEVANCRAIVPDANTAAALEWTQVGYDDGFWPSDGPLGVGYEDGSGYRGFIGTDVADEMSDVHGSCYIRIPFQVDDATALSALGGLTLALRYDDGFVAYLNGEKVAEANAPGDPAWNSLATDGHSDSEADDFVEFEIGASGLAALAVGENVLAIHGLNDGIGSSDFLIQPKLVARYPTEVNAAPSVDLGADRFAVARDEPVSLVAVASDPDGDTLAYAWHFGEGDEFAAEGLNSSTASKAWGSDGEYVVQVTVSDRKGGVSRDQVVINVGSDETQLGQVRGRVLAGGLPVSGARVWAGDVQTFSDDAGRYILAGLGGGAHDVRAISDGDVFTATVAMPLTVDGHVDGIDFWAFGSDSHLAGGGVLTVSPADISTDIGVAVPLAASWWSGDEGEAETLVGFGDAGWRYLDDGSDLGTAWKESVFDDSAWGVGGAPLGFGESGLGTELGYGGDANDKFITSYFRKEVTVTGVEEISRLQLSVRRDDGVVVYVNGTEVLRDNIRPGDSVVASREAFNEITGSQEDEILVVSLPAGIFVEGLNVIAAEVHLENQDSDDLYFDLALTGRRNVSPPALVSWTVAPASGATISSGGEFVASAAGEYEVTAQANGQEVKASVVVASDVEVSVAAVDPVAMEWDGSGGLIRFERSHAVGELEVAVSFAGTAAAGSDYVAPGGTVTFADGQSAVELGLEALDDAEAEGFETIVVRVNPDSRFRVVGSGSGVIWLEDDDTHPEPVVAITEPSVAPGEAFAVDLGVPVEISASVIESEVLVAKGSGWRFLDDGLGATSQWTGASFVDSGWREGLGKFGYGDGDEVTAIDFGEDEDAKHITTYFRKAFEVEQSDGIDSLRLGLLVDDGAIVYVNGVEVLRRNLGDGAVSATTRAESAVGGSDEDTYFEYQILPDSLLEGSNVLAVEVHQSSPTSSDMGFDLELVAERSGTGGVSVNWATQGGTVEAPGDLSTRVAYADPGRWILSVAATGLSGAAAVDSVEFVVSGDSYTTWVEALGIPVGQRGENDDADGDGIVNLVEFAMGMDGLAPDPNVPVESVPGSPWQVSFVRRRGGSGDVGDYLAAGVNYRVWISTDGSSWVPGVGELVLVGTEDLGGGLERVTIEVNTGTEPGAVLLRIEVST